MWGWNGPRRRFISDVDLKKSLAVLIDDMMKRLDRVEKVVGLKGNGTMSTIDHSLVNAKGMSMLFKFLFEY